VAGRLLATVVVIVVGCAIYRAPTLIPPNHRRPDTDNIFCFNFIFHAFLKRKKRSLYVPPHPLFRGFSFLFFLFQGKRRRKRKGKKTINLQSLPSTVFLLAGGKYPLFLLEVG